MERLNHAWVAFLSWSVEGVRWIEGNVYLTPELAEKLLIIGLFASAAITTVIAATQPRERGLGIGRTRLLFAIACAGLFSILVASVLVVIPGLRGSADHRCADYGGGAVTYVLVSGPQILAADTARKYNEQIVLIVVRQQALWGEDPHTCVLDYGDVRVAKLIRAFEALMEHNKEFMLQSMSDGAVTFSFGNGVEIPNVTLAPSAPPPGKTAPPEKAPSPI